MKRTVKLTSEGFSYHTFELKWNPSHSIFRKICDHLRDISKHNQFYPLQYDSRCYFCGVLLQSGIRIYLTETDHRNVVKLIVNPRKVIDPWASYLGTMPPDSQSLEQLECGFTDCMRKLHLPEFLDDWKLSRIDLCTNLQWNKKEGPRTLIRMLQEEPVPAGYCRKQYPDQSGQDAKLQAEHILALGNKSVTLVVYDKIFQIVRENLALPHEKLPKGVLRVELQCHKPFLRDYKDDHHLNGTCEFLSALSQDSRELICRYAQELYFGGTYYKQSELEHSLQNTPGLQSKRRKALLSLSQTMRIADTMEDIPELTGLSKKQLRTCLQRFEELDIHPIPLQDNCAFENMPSLPALLQELAEDETTLYLRRKKKQPVKEILCNVC